MISNSPTGCANASTSDVALAARLCSATTASMTRPVSDSFVLIKTRDGTSTLTVEQVKSFVHRRVTYRLYPSAKQGVAPSGDA